MNGSQREVLRTAVKRRCRGLMAKKNVVSVGVGHKVTAGRDTRTPCVVVGVTRKQPMLDLAVGDRVPNSVDGLPTDVVVVGTITAPPPGSEPSTLRTDRIRPALPGCSVAHFNVTAGTFGAVVKDSDALFILSNSHVIADSGDGEVGDPVYQPGPADGGDAGDQVADLAYFVPIHFEGDPGDPIPDPPDLPSECGVASFFAGALNAAAALFGSDTRLRPMKPGKWGPGELALLANGPNLVDAAIALVESSGLVNPVPLGLPQPSGVAEVQVGDLVLKSGRTTGVTQGFVLQTDVVVQVEYGLGQVAVFEDQVISDIRSAGGDSGSLIQSGAGEAVGLLFAGGAGVTVFNRIENVLSALGVELA